MARILLDKPADDWNEALPIGNGTMGAMVWGGTVVEHLQLNEDSLWCGGPRDRINPDARLVLDDVRRLLFEGRAAEAEELARRGMLCPLPHMAHYEPLGDLWIDLADKPPVRELRSYSVRAGFGLPCT